MYKNYRIVVAAFLHDPTVTISKLKCCNGQLIVDSRKVHSWLHTDIVDSACEHTLKVQSLFQCDQGIVLGKAFDRFDCYPDAVLNVAIDLKSALPIGSAVYDIIIPDIIKISTSTASGVEVFDLLVAGPQRHRVLLHQTSMYNRTIIQVDEDQCASACTEEYGSWCRSFDYSVSSQICRMAAPGRSKWAT